MRQRIPVQDYLFWSWPAIKKFENKKAQKREVHNKDETRCYGILRTRDEWGGGRGLVYPVIYSPLYYLTFGSTIADIPGVQPMKKRIIIVDLHFGLSNFYKIERTSPTSFNNGFKRGCQPREDQIVEVNNKIRNTKINKNNAMKLLLNGTK